MQGFSAKIQRPAALQRILQPFRCGKMVGAALDEQRRGGEKMSGFKCYGVSKGRGVGIFGTWKECRAMVKDFPGARYRGFYSRADAEKWLAYEGIQEKAESRQHNDG